MKYRNLLFVLFGLICPLMGAGAAGLSGVASVNITSDTAAVAKNMALEEARRQILSDTLSRYALPDQLAVAISGADSNTLANLIETTAISGEKLSDTTYSADISMTVSVDAARAWLGENNIQNWLPTGSSADTFVVAATLSDKMADWIDINRIARDENIVLDTKSIVGGMVTMELPKAMRAKFTIALRDAGWHYADTDGVLRIWRQ